MKHLKNSIFKHWCVNLLGFIIFVITNFLIFKICYGLGWLDVFESDLVPIVSICNFISVYIIVTICVLILNLKTRVSEINIVIRKNEHLVTVILFIFFIIVWLKCDGNNSLIAVYLITTFVFYSSVKYESTRVFKYPIQSNKEVLSSYVEKPVVGREYLTKGQCEALDLLIKLLDERTRTDCFNAALIGGWGQGKTSVTDTLIYELQNRDENDPNYHILKINTQVFSNTSNIVEYVKDYFYSLFKSNGLVNLEGKSSVAFASTLADMIKVTEPASLIDGVIKISNEKWFSDIENERFIFEERVQKLLKKTNKKNIVFIIDDADRTDVKDQILQLLSEFTSINGIISIISLDKNADRTIRPRTIDHVTNNENDNKEKDKLYEPIDKYIHVRIRIKDQSRIEYENSIKKQILTEFEKIQKDGLYYIGCVKKQEERGLFSNITDYSTQRVNPGETYITGGAHNILTDILYLNLAANNHSLGEYIKELILGYFYNCKETKQCLSMPSSYFTSKDENRLFASIFSWFHLPMNDEFDWTMGINGNLSNYVFTLDLLINTIDDIKTASNSIKSDITTFEDIYEYLMIKKFPMDGRTWENRKKEPIYYSGMEELKYFIFPNSKSNNEFNDDILNKWLFEGNYDAIKIKLKDSLKVLYKLFITITGLLDFIGYMRDTMNNYRTFKMQLREAELLGDDYLNYLTKEWSPTEKTQKQILDMREHSSNFKELPLEWPPIGAFINTIVYENVITKYGTRFEDDKLKDYRAWLLYGDNRTLLIVTGVDDNDNIVYFPMTIDGNEATIISEEEKTAIQEKAYILYNIHNV